MGLVDRAKNIIVTPKTEWAVVETETAEPGAIITGYVLPLALIPAIAAFIGYGLVGVPVPFLGTFRDIGWGIGQAIQQLLGAVLGVYISAAVINMLAPNFESQKDLGRAMQLVAYSYTPVWVAGILLLYPAVGGIIVGLAGIYALYLLYLGFPFTMKTPKEKVVIYMVISIVVLIVVYIILGLIIGGIMTAVGLGMSGIPGMP